MTQKHTPGPWKVGQDSTAIEASGAIVARTFHWVNEYTPIHEGYANARLIAAAPDLLAALQDLLSATEETYDNRHERQAALDAIAKATT